MSYLIGLTALGALGGWWYAQSFRPRLPDAPVAGEEEGAISAGEQLRLVSRIRAVLVGAAVGAALGGKLWLLPISV